jgi:hypothetical protein
VHSLRHGLAANGGSFRTLRLITILISVQSEIDDPNRVFGGCAAISIKSQVSYVPNTVIAKRGAFP